MNTTSSPAPLADSYAARCHAIASRWEDKKHEFFLLQQRAQRFYTQCDTVRMCLAEEQARQTTAATSGRVVDTAAIATVLSGAAAAGVMQLVNTKKGGRSEDDSNAHLPDVLIPERNAQFEQARPLDEHHQERINDSRSRSGDGDDDLSHVMMGRRSIDHAELSAVKQRIRAALDERERRKVDVKVVDDHLGHALPRAARRGSGRFSAALSDDDELPRILVSAGSAASTPHSSAARHPSTILNTTVTSAAGSAVTKVLAAAAPILIPAVADFAMEQFHNLTTNAPPGSPHASVRTMSRRQSAAPSPAESLHQTGDEANPHPPPLSLPPPSTSSAVARNVSQFLSAIDGRGSPPPPSAATQARALSKSELADVHELLAKQAPAQPPADCSKFADVKEKAEFDAYVVQLRRTPSTFRQWKHRHIFLCRQWLIVFRKGSNPSDEAADYLYIPCCKLKNDETNELHGRCPTISLRRGGHATAPPGGDGKPIPAEIVLCFDDEEEHVKWIKHLSGVHKRAVDAAIHEVHG